MTMNFSGLDSIVPSSVQMAPLDLAVLGDGQLDGHVAVGVRADADLRLRAVLAGAASAVAVAVAV